VSGRMSANTGRAPCNAKALAVETKVKEGTITSSPGPMPRRIAAISRACVQEVVTRADRHPTTSRRSFWHFLEYVWSPATCPIRMVSKMYSSSRPWSDERLNGIMESCMVGWKKNGLR
jgi:hypothetical protein